MHLSAPGKRFSALLGVDSNDLGYYSSLGRGNLVVAIEVNGKEAFRSPAMREGQMAIPVDIDLAGATDFILRITGKDGSVDFADAKVTQSNGQEIGLGDLPIGPLRAEYTISPPFSFVYGGKKSSEIMKDWSVQRNSRTLDPLRTEHTQIYKDKGTGLEVRLVGVEYHDFPTVEWTVYFKNAGHAETPIIEKIQALDTRLERNGDGEFLLHHNKGAPATPNDYEPYETLLGKDSRNTLSGYGGRPSNKDLPYFNLAWPDEGVIIVVGWPGQWASQIRAR